MLTILEFIIILIAFLVITRCVRALFLIYSWEVLPVVKETRPEGPLLSVIIPARDEERSIERCLDSLLKQTYPNFEIIVIDDQSGDRTAEIVKKFTERNPRMKLIQGQPLPQGWLGKCWAIQQATKMAQGEWFLFSDADVIHLPQALASAYGYAARENVDFLTLKYTLLTKTFWEKVVLPCIYFLENWFIVSPKQVNNSNNLAAILAKGDFILVKRKAYEQVGGHQAVKNELIESAALMREFKRNGRKVRLLDGSKLIRVRKFHNLKEILNSYFKLLYYTFTPVKSRFGGLVDTGIMLSSVVPIVVLISLLLSNSLHENVILTVGSLAAALSLFLAAMFFYKQDNFNPWYALGLPLGVLMTCFISLKALLATSLGKSLIWRDRVYEQNLAFKDKFGEKT